MADNVSIYNGPLAAYDAATKDIGGKHHAKVILTDDLGSFFGKVQDTARAGTDRGIPILAARKDAPASLVDADGDWSVLQLTDQGFLRTVLGAGVEAIGSVIVTSVPAAAATSDQFGSVDDGSKIMNGLVPMTPKIAFASIAASQTDSILVPAVSGKRIKIIKGWAQTDATATQATLKSKGAGAGTAIAPPFRNAANLGEVLNGGDAYGWPKTNVGEALAVDTGTGSTTSFWFLYVEE